MQEETTVTRNVAVLLTMFGCLLAAPPNSFAQKSDQRALKLATQSIAALTGRTSIADITLQGNATWRVGPNKETGSVTLMAKGIGQSRVDLNMSSFQRSDILDNSTGIPQGAWVLNGGETKHYAPHNSWTDSAWFYAGLSSLAAGLSNPSVILSYVGLENRGNRSVQHLRSYMVPERRGNGLLRDLPKSYSYLARPSSIQRLSTQDFYLDSGSFFPVAITFNTHPDNDPSTDIRIEIDFSNYQVVNGVRLPFHIQRFVQGCPTLDISVSNGTVNSGLSDGSFAIRQ